MSQSTINDFSTKHEGRKKIEWVETEKHMPIIHQLVEEFKLFQPLTGYVIVTSVHLEAKTARLVQVLADLGATVYATGCNPLSTQDDVVAALRQTPHVEVYAKYDCSDEEYWGFLKQALSHKPHIIIDDGGDLVKLLHSKEGKEYGERLYGGCEETTTGVHRLKALAEKGELKFPMINVNDANCKHLFDNYYGTGQSVADGIIRTTNLIIAGKTVVVAGYGDCGSGIAERMRGLGAHVIITEINPIKALKAHMDGFTVMTMDKAARYGDLFVTATGCADVIRIRHFEVMQDGAIMANAGHFNVEINLEDLKDRAIGAHQAKPNITAYRIMNINAPTKTLYVLAEGRLVNLAAADGHAAEIMDMSFSIQLLSVIHIAQHFNSTTQPLLYSVPKYIDDKVAHLALKANKVKIDKLTKAQKAYLENGF